MAYCVRRVWAGGTVAQVWLLAAAPALLRNVLHAGAQCKGTAKKNCNVDWDLHTTDGPSLGT